MLSPPRTWLCGQKSSVTPGHAAYLQALSWTVLHCGPITMPTRRSTSGPSVPKKSSLTVGFQLQRPQSYCFQNSISDRRRIDRASSRRAIGNCWLAPHLSVSQIFLWRSHVSTCFRGGPCPMSAVGCGLRGSRNATHTSGANRSFNLTHICQRACVCYSSFFDDRHWHAENESSIYCIGGQLRRCGRGGRNLCCFVHSRDLPRSC